LGLVSNQIQFGTKTKPGPGSGTKPEVLKILIFWEEKTWNQGLTGN
jgi:hypothetical protein